MFSKDNLLYFVMAFHPGLAKHVKWKSQRQRIGYTLDLLPSSRDVSLLGSWRSYAVSFSLQSVCPRFARWNCLSRLRSRCATQTCLLWPLFYCILLRKRGVWSVGSLCGGKCHLFNLHISNSDFSQEVTNFKIFIFCCIILTRWENQKFLGDFHCLQHI